MMMIWHNNQPCGRWKLQQNNDDDDKMMTTTTTNSMTMTTTTNNNNIDNNDEDNVMADDDEWTNDEWTVEWKTQHNNQPEDDDEWTNDEQANNDERMINEQWMNDNNEQIVDDYAVYDVAWLITLAKTMSWVLERLRSGWQCHRSCDNDVAKLGEIALATTMLRGLLISRRQCRRDDNNNGNDNDNKNARIKQRGEWQWQCRWWRWCNNQTLREQ